ncbi:hypothetical protein F7725_027547 [Dissostichus mawsoni]|uniref:Uncharacterized protein n=1 Tax=Dissostichus mawsoni TaxID=36200 RepID=A0A7J5XE50_DISMA|nr:hypothetical protein F7725_027547 [Dissostichus mawsoni]
MFRKMSYRQHVCFVTVAAFPSMLALLTGCIFFLLAKLLICPAMSFQLHGYVQYSMFCCLTSQNFFQPDVSASA